MGYVCPECGVVTQYVKDKYYVSCSHVRVEVMDSKQDFDTKRCTNCDGVVYIGHGKDAKIATVTGNDCCYEFGVAYKKDSEAEDVVIHPKHYQSSLGVECIDVIEGLELPYHLGNTLKYMWRAGKKHSRVLEDLKKARWYLDRYIELLEKEKKPS